MTLSPLMQSRHNRYAQIQKYLHASIHEFQGKLNKQKKRSHKGLHVSSQLEFLNHRIQLFQNRITFTKKRNLACT
jgi:hypothetical protein